MMKFHVVHGASIALSENRTVATRSDTSFCNGIVFSDQPLKINQKICLEIINSESWSGAFRVGISAFDPAKFSSQELPKYSIPNLSKKEGFWICPVSEKLVSVGCNVTLYINNTGQLQFFENSAYKGACITGLPVNRSLWLCLDLYGNTRGAKFIKPDEAPKEILARGPDALQAYEEACISGTQAVYRTRLMLVGQDRVGKTSLKRALTGQQHNEEEEGTVGIDLSASCSFSITSWEQWKMAIQGDLEKESDSETEQRKLGIMGGIVGLEEEYHRALAENIVKELSQIKTRNTVKGRTPSRDSMKSTSRKTSDRDSLKSGTSTRGGISNLPDKLSHVPPELFTDVPERVVELVQEILEKGKEPSISNSQRGSRSSISKRPTAMKSADAHPEPQTSFQTSEDKKIVLNIWDFAGQSIYYTTHQVFLTSRAVYVIVFNLCHDLYSQGTWNNMSDEELCTLDYMDYWMRTIYAHTSQNHTVSIDNTKLSPPIFIVGTHRNSLSSDVEEQNRLVEEKFKEIRTFLMDKPYTRHIITPFLAVENNLSEEDTQIGELRKLIEDVAGREPYMGEQMPIRWLKFEQEMAKLVEDDTYIASVDQIQEIACNLGIRDDQEVKIMLDFYHDLGVLIYYGSSGVLDNLLRNTVILKPHWLVEMFRKIVLAKQNQDKWSLTKDKWRLLEEKGILEDSLVDDLWKPFPTQKVVLLGLMEKFDLLCPGPTQLDFSTKYYFVPSRQTSINDSQKRLYAESSNNAVFYVDFCGFLPEGLFHRILTRTTKWCLEKSKKEPYSLLHKQGRFYLDSSHDFVLEMAPRKLHRIKVVIVRIDDTASTDNEENNKNLSPKPKSCAKLRNFLEMTLTELKESWMKRLTYHTCVECSCDRPCYLHGDGLCKEEGCLHFLDLDECLANRIVCCEHRRVKTTNIKKWFPEAHSQAFQGQVLPSIDLEESQGNIEKHGPQLPIWVKGAAKLLSSGEENQDWMALAKLMGYKESQIEKFIDDLNPALALLADWIITSGNTSLSVDMLINFLDKMNRDDVLEVIEKANDVNKEPPQVFISYQWDCQDEVKALRDKLEKCGFSCWMDIGQMGGGDFLSAKIDHGIRNCKVVIACITPKYVVSHHCNREISLADLLSKPIIPVMFDEVPWPPPGGMSLIFSQLIYINMRGIGGHGGTGIHADLKDKYREIVQKLMNYIVPDLSRYFDTETLSSKQFSNINDDSSLNSDDALIPVLSRSNVSYQMNIQRGARQEDIVPPPPHYQPREQVPVSQSCVCSIL